MKKREGEKCISGSLFQESGYNHVSNFLRDYNIDHVSFQSSRKICDVFRNVFLESQDNLVDQEFSSRYELSPPPAEQDPSHFCHFVFSKSKIVKTKKNLSVLTMPMDPWIEKSILETFLKIQIRPLSSLFGKN